MAGTELQSTRGDVAAEVPSAEWGWSGEAPKFFRVMAVIAAVFLLLWGLILSTVDNLLRPYLVAGRADEADRFQAKRRREVTQRQAARRHDQHVPASERAAEHEGCEQAARRGRGRRGVTSGERAPDAVEPTGE